MFNLEEMEKIFKTTGVLTFSHSGKLLPHNDEQRCHCVAMFENLPMAVKFIQQLTCCGVFDGFVVDDDRYEKSGLLPISVYVIMKNLPFTLET